MITPSPHDIDVTTSKGFIQDLLVRIKSIDMGGLGAQLAYFFLLSFFPLLIFLVTLLPYLNLPQEQVFEFIEGIVPSEVFLMIESVLSEVLTNHNGKLLSIGILGTIWSASRGVNALVKALNLAYDVEGKSGFIDRIWAFGFTISLVGVIIIALIFPVFGQQIGHIIFSHLGVEQSFAMIWNMLRWITPPLLIFLILWLMYWVIPNTDPRLNMFSVVPGAVFATLGWLILTSGFSVYISNFGNYSATYGSIGGVIILMLWLYFTGMILIFGGLLNASIQRRNLALLTKSSAKRV